MPNRQVQKALALFNSRSPGSFVVGGAVRDRLLGAEPADIDVSVAGDAQAQASQVAAELAAKVIVLDPRRGHVRLAVHSGNADHFIDVTSHSVGLDADLRGRDFTINAMAVPLHAWLGGDQGFSGAVIDPTGGILDLEAGLVRMTSVRSFAEDAVRLVRAARFASVLGFDIEPETFRACRAMAGRVVNTSPERSKEEIYVMFSAESASRSVRLLDEMGVLEVLVPELSEGKGVIQPPNHHYYDVFTHCARTVAKVDLVIDSALQLGADPRLPGALAPSFPGLDQHLDAIVGDGQSHRTLLRLSALLHDVAKPRCKSFEESGRMRFLGHSEMGAKMAEEILGRLRCSRRVISHVSTLVRHHLRPSQASSAGRPPTARALVRFFRDLRDVALDVVYLNMADYLAARGPMLSASGWRAYSKHCGDILSGGLEAPAQSRPFLLLDGTEVMAEFGLKPGPEVGRLLNALGAAEADGSVQDRQDALEFLRRLV